MDHLKLAHRYDGGGHRRPFDDIPKKLTKLADDPYRSLSAWLREAGGYSKDTEPFADFLWADFLRRRIDAALLQSDRDGALKKAFALSHDQAAEHLPGWSPAPQNMK